MIREMSRECYAIVKLIISQLTHTYQINNGKQYGISLLKFLFTEDIVVRKYLK